MPKRTLAFFPLSFFIAVASLAAQTTPTVVKSAVATPVPGGSYPRIGSVFNGEALYTANPSEADQVQLYLSGNFIPPDAQAIRTAAPKTPNLAPVNAIETLLGAPVVPDSYYLKDIHGNRIQTWPGNPGDYLLNLTLPAVQQFLGQYAYQVMTQSGFVYDGVFFDNIETTISNVTQDVYGNPVQIDANNDGIADDPGTLNTAWSAGVYNMIAAFKQLAPNAYAVGHANQTPPDPRSLAVFNGDSFVFDLVYVREGSMAFGTLWDAYHQWFTQGQQQPVVTSIQSSPPSQIAYGYGFSPIGTALPSVMNFGQTFYPNMRFGLAMTLMNNGFSSFSIGDSNSITTWWYDEYNFNLGTPLGPYTALGTPASANEIANGGFEGSFSPWHFSVNNDGSASATASIDTSTAEDGASSGHINVKSAGTANWHVSLEQDNISLIAGDEYKIQFWAKADKPVSFQLFAQGGAPSYSFYGLNAVIAVNTTWNLYSVSFIAPLTGNDGRLEFFLGNSAANLWFDDIQLVQAETRLYRRDFTNGTVLLNGTSSSQTISLGSGFQHFTGSQAPKQQYIIDDTNAAFSFSGAWFTDTFDTGFRTAYPPYYHAWNKTLHELDASSGSAQWQLGIPTDSQYTIQVWLPSAPGSASWTKNAIYKILSGSQVLGTFTLDQSSASGGDQWHTLTTNINLTAASNPVLQISNGGSGPLIADAVYITSASRYNDGSPATQVTLQPMDGILLQRTNTTAQTIYFTAPGNQSLASGSVALSASATSGLAVSFTSNSASVCTISGSTAKLLSAGTCSITASQTGNSAYSAALPVSQNFTVSGVAAPIYTQTIAFGSIANQTAGTKLTLTASTTSGLPVSYTSSTSGVCSVSGNIASLLAAGTCTIVASQSGNVYFSAAPSVAQSFSVAGATSTPPSGGGSPSVVYFTPSSGSGAAQTFSGLISDPNGAADVGAVFLLFNSSINGANACYIQYYASTNLLFLANDTNTGFVGSFTPGASTQLSNSQCTVSGAGTYYNPYLNTAKLTVPITFAHAAQSNIYLYGVERNGLNTGWTQVGTWAAVASSNGSGGGTITTAGSTLGVVSLLPHAGSGKSQTFTGYYSDTAGAANLNALYMLFNQSLTGINGCYVQYYVATNTLSLSNDANTGFVGSLTPGSSGQLSNSTCTLSGSGSSYNYYNNTAFLSVSLTFSGTSPLTAFLYSSDKSGDTSGWITKGTWTP